MANIITEQKIIDNNKRALVKYVFQYVDTASVANTVLLDASMLSGALNTNGYIMSSNTNPKSTYRTKIKRVFGMAKLTNSARLQWQGDSNSTIVTFNTGSFDYNFENLGDNAVIANPEANATGDILLSGTMASGDIFTLFVDLRKDSEDYNAGQFNDPVAFNQGPARLV